VLAGSPLLAAWLIVPHLFGELQARCLEGGSAGLAILVTGTVVGQLGVLAGIAVPLATLLVARELAGEVGAEGEEKSSGE